MIKMDEAVDMLVGNPTADSEHLELILLINLIHTYSITKEYETSVPGLVVLFTTKLLAHCKSEEKILADIDSPTLEAHIEEHTRLVAKTVEMLDNITVDTVKAFKMLLTNHIRTYDLVGFSV